jgi:hypothetical protein
LSIFSDSVNASRSRNTGSGSQHYPCLVESTTRKDSLEMEKGEILDVSQGLHSLLKAPGDDISQSLPISDSDESDDSLPRFVAGIRIRHASFRDYR